MLRLPGIGARGPLTERARQAGAAMVVFVDEARARPMPVEFLERGRLPILAAGGTSATALIAAGQAGSPVTVSVAASPVAYGVLHADLAGLDPEPVA